MKRSVPIFRLKRQARLLARHTGQPLHRALDDIAKGEGFNGWSHLVAQVANWNPAARLLARLLPGDLALIGARPGQGKTMMGLRLIV